MEFDENDLAANRQGVMSERQKAYLTERSGKKRLWLILLVAPIDFLIWGGVTIYILTNEDGADLPFVIGLAAMVTASSLVLAVLMLRTVMRPQLYSLVGSVEVKQAEGLRYELEVEGERLEFEGGGFQIIDGYVYTVYYGKIGSEKIVVGMEAV